MKLNRSTFASLEFLLLVLANIANWVAVAADQYAGSYGAYLTAGSVALYAVVRGLAKVNSDGKNYWQTTEFWAAIAGSAPAVVEAFRSNISPHTFALIQAGVVAALGVAQGLRKDPVVQAGDPAGPPIEDPIDPVLDGSDQAVEPSAAPAA